MCFITGALLLGLLIFYAKSITDTREMRAVISLSSTIILNGSRPNH